MQTATADPLVGRTLESRYRIVERIARGGMSTVYAAVDERLDRLVAVKVMSAALSADPAFSDRFSREARAAARLTHLNAVSVYDQGVDISPAGHHVFLVMELVEGRTLRALLRERGKLTPAEAISIMEPVLSALSAAHHAGLVHRDIKPENILLSDDGVVKVADFGLARAVESDAAATRTGLMMGTVAYCAPEQISKGRADQRSDVYSAGVVLFELLTGKPPYQGETAMNVAYQHVHSRVPAPSSVVKGIPSEIDELVVDATDSDPAGRPLDAGAFLAHVADVRTDLDLPVVPVPPRERPRRIAGGSTRGTGLVAPAVVDAHSDTTDVLGARTAGVHDTTVVANNHLAAVADQAELVPPPPIVIPPKKTRRQPTARVRRRRRALIFLATVVLLGATAMYGGWWFAAGRYAHVPKVAGLTQDAAIQHLRDAGYKVAADVTNSFSETVPKGSVISTDPSAGARLVRGKTVSLVVSSGKERFKVPTVTGQSQADAQAALATIPVQVVLSQANNDKVPKGNAVGTDPPAGTAVKRSQAVKLIISAGPPVLDIPNIDPGTPYSQAKQALEKIGFKTARAEEFSTTIAKEGVIAISPTGSAVKFSTITITVSKGPQNVTIPKELTGQSSGAAKALLESLGLVVTLDTSYDGGVFDRVVGVRADGVNGDARGKQVPVGTNVTLLVV